MIVPGRRRRGRIGRWVALAAAAGALLAAASCSSVGYYWQSAVGQAELLAKAEPIDRLVADEAVDGDLRRRLETVREVRAFASGELGLPDNGSYRQFARLGRPFVVWNVVAAPELSLEPRQWCFPVAGCVSYRGFFAEDDARAEAARLRAEGYDVHLGGIPAYSTLGFFDDPVLDTFVRYSDTELARLIFHELSHQVVYVRDDTTFNESFATTVEEVGIERWLAARGDAEARRQFTRMRQIRADFHALLGRYRALLARVYAAALPEEEMRRRKAATLDALRSEYASIRAERWGGYSGYDGFFGESLNNASLSAVALYTDQVPLFRALLERLDGDLPRFYDAVRGLEAVPVDERTAALLAAVR